MRCVWLDALFPFSPSLRGEGWDELVTIRIVMPDNVDDTLSYFLAEWRQKHAYDPGRD